MLFLLNINLNDSDFEMNSLQSVHNYAFISFADDSGWETVKNRSRWRLSGNYNPKNRFNKPTCAVSLPALIIVDDEDDSVVTKSSLSKQISQDTTPNRRHSEKIDPLPPDIGQPQRSPKQRSLDPSTTPKLKPLKSANSNPKQLTGKKIEKHVQKENCNLNLKTKAEVWPYSLLFTKHKQVEGKTILFKHLI